jgi:hypothetical protein
MENAKTTSVMYYNAMYGIDGSNLPAFLKSHYYHFVGRHPEMDPMCDVTRILDVVDSTRADVLALSELFGRDQRKEVIGGLGEMGYRDFSVGRGHGFKGKPGDNVEMLLATRGDSSQIEVPEIQAPSKMGHGGGITCSHIESLNCDVIATQMAFPGNRETFDAQVDAIVGLLKRGVEDTSRRVILLGDFNVTPEEVQSQFPELIEGLDLLSPNEVTCSTVPLIRRLFGKCLDHVYGRGFNVLDARTIKGASDHKAVFVELEAV